MTTTVHSKPSCVQCTATFRKLDKEGISYEVVQLTEESVEAFKADGHMQAPVIVSPIGTWAGFMPAKIMELKEAGL